MKRSLVLFLVHLLAACASQLPTDTDARAPGWQPCQLLACDDATDTDASEGGQ